MRNEQNKNHKIILNRDHYRWAAPRSVGMRGIGAASALYPALKPCGMTKSSVRGFTLIELLVVVLIIGILTAIALPQYNKAVLKARLAAILPYIQAVQVAQEAYFLANDQYATNLDDLDLQVTCPPAYECEMQVGTLGSYQNEAKIQARIKGREHIAIVGSFSRRSHYIGTKGQIYCWASPTDPKAVEICKSWGGALLDTADGEYRYAI